MNARVLPQGPRPTQRDHARTAACAYAARFKMSANASRADGRGLPIPTSKRSGRSVPVTASARVTQTSNII